MFTNSPNLRLFLSFISGMIFMLAAYIIADYYIETFLTTYRWQIKALAIYNLIGGTQETWWTEKTTLIAWNLLLNNRELIGWVWTGAISALIKLLSLKRST